VPVDPDALASALAVRLGRPAAELREDAGSGSPTWVLDVAAERDGALLALHDPGGQTWERHIAWTPEASAVERVRDVAVAAEYLLGLSRSPFVPLGSVVEPLVPEPAPVPAPPVLPVPEPTVGEADGGTSAPAEVWELVPPALPPVEPPEEEPSGTRVRLDGVLLLGGASDLSFETRGDSKSFALAIRTGLEWSWGLWIEAEAGWHFARASFPEALELHQLPVRVGAGATIPAEMWRIRMAFQGVFEAWWTTGGTPRSGWRTGAGFLLSGSLRPLPWLEAGVDLGVELLPHGIELIYGDIPVFSLGPWRWRGMVWVGFGGDLGL
jgi:hypothetical protein